MRHPSPITTVTLNPALDVSTSTPEVVSEHKLRCGPTRLDPGGGGVNVSRVIRNLGGHSTAVYALGGPTGHAYRELLEDEGLVGRVVHLTGSTRESFTVDETSTGKQFRFVLQGPEVSEREWSAALDAVESAIAHGGFVVASGSLPPGVPDDFYARVARLAKAQGCRAVVDASGPALREALAEGVFMVKPSRRELAQHVGRELATTEDQVAAASELVSAGQAECVALTLGGDGAVLATRDGVLRLPSPHVEVSSAVGAGDAFVGAFVLWLARGHGLEEAFRAAVASGSATAMLTGTDMTRREDLERLAAELTVERL